MTRARPSPKRRTRVGLAPYEASRIRPAAPDPAFATGRAGARRPQSSPGGRPCPRRPLGAGRRQAAPDIGREHLHGRRGRYGASARGPEPRCPPARKAAPASGDRRHPGAAPLGRERQGAGTARRAGESVVVTCAVSDLRSRTLIPQTAPKRESPEARSEQSSLASGAPAQPPETTACAAAGVVLTRHRSAV